MSYAVCTLPVNHLPEPIASNGSLLTNTFIFKHRHNYVTIIIQHTVMYCQYIIIVHILYVFYLCVLYLNHRWKNKKSIFWNSCKGAAEALMPLPAWDFPGIFSYDAPQHLLAIPPEVKQHAKQSKAKGHGNVGIFLSINPMGNAVKCSKWRGIHLKYYLCHHFCVTCDF